MLGEKEIGRRHFRVEIGKRVLQALGLYPVDFGKQLKDQLIVHFRETVGLLGGWIER